MLQPLQRFMMCIQHCIVLWPRFQVREKLLKLRVGTGLKRQFERFDTLRTGSLNITQLRQALAHLGVELTSQELRVIFDNIDSNGSGGIRCVFAAAIVFSVDEAVVMSCCFPPQLRGNGRVFGGAQASPCCCAVDVQAGPGCWQGQQVTTISWCQGQ